MSGRSYYSAPIIDFLEESSYSILGKMTESNLFDLTDEQRFTWGEEISIMKDQLQGVDDGRIFFEYTIPRMGKKCGLCSAV